MRLQGIQHHRITGLILLVCVVLILNIPVHAQGENLLSNPGFEDGFRAVPGENSPRNVANGWQPWNATRTPDMDSFQNAQPTYFAASNASAQRAIPRIRTGEDAQVYSSFFETHDAGVYQQVSGIEPGAEIRFSIYGYVHSNRLDDLNVSEDPGGVAFRVGIDPTGGTDPFGDDVIYSEAAIFYDAFRQYAIITNAESDTVTVFVRTTISEPVQFTYVYLDDAVLELTPEQATEVPTATDTEVPTATDTDAPTATNTPTEEPTATDVPSDTPTTDPDTDDPTPTREDNGGVLPTATEIGVLPTATDTPTDGPTATPTATQQPISEAFPGQIIHTVQRGDTVGQLATRYGSTIEAITQANSLNENALIFVGQGLIIPVRVVPATETPSATPVVIVVTPTPGDGGGPISADTYVVQPGDTLFGIAQRYNTTIGTLVQLNGITNPNRIFYGQRLRLPVSGGTPPTATPVVNPTATQPDDLAPTPTAPPPQPTTYTVQPGDNLFRIALRYGVSLVQLANANNITDFNRIFIGQVLIIP